MKLTKEDIDVLVTEFSKDYCVQIAYRFGDEDTITVIKKPISDYRKDCVVVGYVLDNKTKYDFDYTIVGSELKWSYFVRLFNYEDLIIDKNVFTKFINFLNKNNNA